MTIVKFGYWTVEVDEETTNPLLKHRFYCSECGNWQSYGRTLFCPNCGAKMAMTNGDRIRAMTDEELADLLARSGASRFYVRSDTEALQDEKWRWFDWLKQEEKDG